MAKKIVCWLTKMGPPPREKNYGLSLKLALTPNISLIHPKNKEKMNTFHYFSCCDIKVTIMTSYFRIRDDVIKDF